MYPLDVSNEQPFHTAPLWGSRRGLPIGRYYMHRWMAGFLRSKHARSLPASVKCLEIGDGHFIYANKKDHWADTSGMFPFCDVSKSLSADLTDKRAKSHLNLENPFETLQEKQYEATLREGFEFVIVAQVFEHVNKPMNAMQGLGQLVKPGGIVLFSVSAVNALRLMVPFAPMFVLVCGT